MDFQHIHRYVQPSPQSILEYFHPSKENPIAFSYYHPISPLPLPSPKKPLELALAQGRGWVWTSHTVDNPHIAFDSPQTL